MHLAQCLPLETTIPRTHHHAKASPLACAQADDQGNTMTILFDSGDEEGTREFEAILMD